MKRADAEGKQTLVLRYTNNKTFVYFKEVQLSINQTASLECKHVCIIGTYLTTDIFFDKKILSLVVEDHMDFLGSWSTDIWACK